METATQVLLGVNAALLTWLLWEIRRLRNWRHDVVDKGMSRINAKAELAILALRQAGLWKPEYDEALKDE